MYRFPLMETPFPAMETPFPPMETPFPPTQCRFSFANRKNSQSAGISAFWTQQIRKFFEVFASFSKFSVLFGPVWIHLCLFGRIHIRSDAYGCVRMRLAEFGFFFFQIF